MASHCDRSVGAFGTACFSYGLPVGALQPDGLELHQRERSIKAARGRILDAKGKVIADNRTVCTISVIHNQVKDPETVIRVLSEELGLPEAEVRKKTEKRSSREVIKSNVEKTRGDVIRAMRPGGGQGG